MASETTCMDYVQWQQNYSCTGCGACGLLVAPNGTLSDGSGSLNYSNNSRCEWMIASSHVLDSNLLVTIQFTNFSTQPQNDVVRVLECTDIYCSQHQQLAELSGTYLTTKVMASATRYMKVVFTSDGSINSDGFTATWNYVSIYMFLDFIHPKTCFLMFIFPAFSEIFFCQSVAGKPYMFRLQNTVWASQHSKRHIL